jgi:hypothetical protein
MVDSPSREAVVFELPNPPGVVAHDFDRRDVRAFNAASAGRGQ